MEMIPRHVTIVPDGNRRWAADKGLSAVEGHQQGAEATCEIAIAAADRGVKYLSIWGMSLDNFRKRSVGEVRGLLHIFENEFKKLAVSDDIHSRRVRVEVVGRWREKFPAGVQRAIEESRAATKDYSEHVLVFLLAYSGVDDRLTAMRSLVAAGVEPTEEMIQEHLLTAQLPMVDLMIRTGGEPHLSAGYLMWQMADAQLYFTEDYWPAFGKPEFDAALETFAARE